MEAVIFDVDGVLTDSEPLHLDAANRVLDPFGAKLSEEDNLEYLGLDDRAFWKEMINRFQIEADPDTLKASRVAAVIAMIREGIVPLPGVPEFVTGLVMRGLKIGAASSSPRPVVDAILDELGLKNAFQATVTGDEVSQGKPDPEIFLKAAQALNTAPDQCMAVEDSPNGILAARRADMFTVAVQNRYNFNLDLSRADRIFSGLNHFDWTLFEER